VYASSSYNWSPTITYQSGDAYWLSLEAGILYDTRAQLLENEVLNYLVSAVTSFSTPINVPIKSHIYLITLIYNTRSRSAMRQLSVVGAAVHGLCYRSYRNPPTSFQIAVETVRLPCCRTDDCIVFSARARFIAVWNLTSHNFKTLAPAHELGASNISVNKRRWVGSTP
jgi:hypothetical protein